MILLSVIKKTEHKAEELAVFILPKWVKVS